jgi:hypothetical protein
MMGRTGEKSGAEQRAMKDESEVNNIHEALASNKSHNAHESR